jgi:hypothetical protein
MSNPVKAGPFLGINTKLPTSNMRVPNRPNHPGGSFVRDAKNVDLTEVGTFQRRGGMTQVAAATRASSLWSSGDMGYFVDSGVLKQFDGAAVTALATLPSAASTVSLTQTPRGVVWTDGSAPQLITGLTSAPMAVPAPNPVPAATASNGGSLEAGTYTVAFAYVDAAGQRSPLSPFQAVTVGQGGSIILSMPSSAYSTAVAVSAVNGDVLYLETTLPPLVTATAITLVTSQGLPLSNEYEDALPGGTWVRYYRGRLLTVVDDLIFYSHPYNYGTYHPATNFIRLDAPVTLCEPTQTGVFLATAHDTWFLDGLDVATAELKPIAPYGAIPNTAAAEPNTLNLWWSTPRGAVRTTDANTLEMKQDEHIAFSAASTGAALFRESNGLSQVISALSNAVPTGAASASSYMDAVTIN